MPLARAVKLKLQIEFSLEEFNLLDALEREVLWSGRYPSALNIDRSIPIDENGYFKKFIFDYPNDHCATIKLYDRLETILQNQALARPPETSQ